MLCCFLNHEAVFFLILASQSKNVRVYAAVASVSITLRGRGVCSGNAKIFELYCFSQVDLNKMHQKNTKTGTKREIRMCPI